MKLYKKIDNKIRLWYVENNAIHHGLLNGKIQTYNLTRYDKKYIEKLYKDKSNDGYREIPDSKISMVEELLPNNIEDKNGYLKPMKAVPFRKGKTKYPVAVQPKINGFRAMLRYEKADPEDMFSEAGFRFRSKEGLEYLMQHITAPLNQHIHSIRGIWNTADGELHKVDLPLNQHKKFIPTKLDNGTITKPECTHRSHEMYFFCFDLAIPDVSQMDRLKLKDELFAQIKSLRINWINVPHYIVHSDEEVEWYRDTFINAGYEGVILRDLDAEYQFGKRRSNMQKYKKWKETECLVLDVIDKGIQNGLQHIAFLLKNDLNDETFECTPAGQDKTKDARSWTFEDRKRALEDKDLIIGKLATVRYYERSGVKKVPFHSDVLTIRDYE